MKLSLLVFILFFVFSLTAFAQMENERDKGIEFYRQGEYEKAIEILQNSVKMEEKDRLAWMYLGASFVKLKKDNDAAKAFGRRMSSIKRIYPYMIKS